MIFVAPLFITAFHTNMHTKHTGSDGMAFLKDSALYILTEIETQSGEINASVFDFIHTGA